MSEHEPEQEGQGGWRPDVTDVVNLPGEPTEADPAEPDLAAPGSADDVVPAPGSGSGAAGGDEGGDDLGGDRGGGGFLGRDFGDRD